MEVLTLTVPRAAGCILGPGAEWTSDCLTWVWRPGRETLRLQAPQIFLPCAPGVSCTPCSLLSETATQGTEWQVGVCSSVLALPP